MSEIAVDTIRYPRNFLTSVIFRIDFHPILSIREDLKSNFQDAVREQFPKLSHRAMVEFQTKIEHGNVVETKSQPMKEFHLLNSEQQTELTVSQSFLSVESRDYHNFKEFQEIVGPVCRAFEDAYQPISVTRVGLRYINEFKLDTENPLDWKDYFHPDMIGILEGDVLHRENAARIMSQIIYNWGDYKTTFTYGMANSEFPGRIARKEYTLDMDTYSTDVECNEIGSMLQAFNDRMVSLFQSAIGDGIKDLLQEA